MLGRRGCSVLIPLQQETRWISKRNLCNVFLHCSQYSIMFYASKRSMRREWKKTPFNWQWNDNKTTNEETGRKETLAFMGRFLSHYHEWKATEHIWGWWGRREWCWEGAKPLGVDLLIRHKLELHKHLAPSSTVGTGTGARRILCITELAVKHSSHPCTVLSNNLGKIQNGPHEMEKYIQMLCQMWHLVVAFWSWHFWSQA